MYYYKGDISSCLDKVYRFFKSIGYDVEMTDDVIICTFTKSIYKYSMGYDYCEDVGKYVQSLRILCASEGGVMDTKNKITIYNSQSFGVGVSVPPNRLKFENGQWLEMVLSLMIPSSSYRDILDKFKIEIEKYTIDPEFGQSNNIYDISKYIRTAREIKLNMLLDE